MQVGDTVKIKRGVWKGMPGRVTQVINGGERYGVMPIGDDITSPQLPLSLAASSVEPVR